MSAEVTIRAEHRDYLHHIAAESTCVCLNRAVKNARLGPCAKSKRQLAEAGLKDGCQAISKAYSARSSTSSAFACSPVAYAHHLCRQWEFEP